MATNTNGTGHQDPPKPKSLIERLRDKDAIICAEGYLQSFERRGYLQAGPFVPEVVLGRPDLVRLQYEEFVHAGSDVVVALTYYTHRARLQHIGKEDQLEAINRYALRLAKGVAVQTGTLMAGNICDTALFIPNNFDSKEAVKAIFREQVGWAVQEGADFMIGETFGHVGEAILATEVIKEAGLPAVVTLRVTNKFFVDGKLATFDGIELGQALQMLESAGADVVGFNCSTGPRTMLSLLAQYRQCVEVPFAALPVGFRTNEKEVTFQELTDPVTGQKAFPDNLDCVMCSRDEIAEFGRQCAQFGVQYMGICCGNNAGFTRALSESIGRLPPASRFRPDMSKYVSDLHRRLMYLQRVKEMEEEKTEVSGNSSDDEQQVDVNGNVDNKDQANDTRENNIASNNGDTVVSGNNTRTDPIESDSATEKETGNLQNVSDTSEEENIAEVLKESPETNNNIDNDTEEKSIEIAVDKKTGITTRQMSVGAINDSFSIRLPPPPNSKRNRSLPSITTPEKIAFEVRLPPPPGSGIKRRDSRLRRPRASTSSSDDSEDNRLPPTPISDSPSPGSDSSPSLSGLASVSLEESKVTTASANNPDVINNDSNQKNTFNGDTSRLDHQIQGQQNTKSAELSDHPDENINIVENKDGPDKILLQDHGPNFTTGEDLLVGFEADSKKLPPEIKNEHTIASGDVVENLNQGESSESPIASKAMADDTSSTSSGEDDQMTYSRLEKDDDDIEGEPSQTDLSTYNLKSSENVKDTKDTLSDNSSNGNFANFQLDKDAADDWANFDTLRGDSKSSTTASKAKDVDIGDLISMPKPVEIGLNGSTVVNTAVDASKTSDLISITELGSSGVNLMNIEEPIKPGTNSELTLVAETAKPVSSLNLFSISESKPKGNVNIDFGDGHEEDSEA